MEKVSAMLAPLFVAMKEKAMALAPRHVEQALRRSALRDAFPSFVFQIRKDPA